MSNKDSLLPDRVTSLANLPHVVATISQRAAARLEAGHPWVYSSDIERMAAAAGAHERLPGQATVAICEIRTARGRFVGRGVYNSRSVIAVRLFTRAVDSPLDDALVESKVRSAVALRQPLLAGRDPETAACRLIYAEGDGLPGLIADKFGPVVVFQSLAFAAEVCRDTALRVLSADPGLGIRHVVERNDAPVRQIEGLAEARGPWPKGAPAPPEPLEIREGEVRFRVDLLEGQKTGHYLDQRDNRAMVGMLARELARQVAAAGRRLAVLDCFSYTGGFAATICRSLGREDRGSAAGTDWLGRIVCVDSSAAALQLAEENLRLNLGPADAEMICANAFDYLRSKDQVTPPAAREMFDLIILDPPPFARERRMVPGALRGYKEINLRAMKLLRPGGYLVTCTCSHHIGREALQQVLVEAAADARRTMRIVAATGQPPDHPVMLGYPEGDYLRCVVLQGIDG